MSARGTTHARLDVHVGPGSAHTLFRGLPGPILIVCRVGGKPPPLDPATLTNSSLSRLPSRRAVLSAEKICDPRIERMIDARRFICHPHLPSFLSSAAAMSRRSFRIGRSVHGPWSIRAQANQKARKNRRIQRAPHRSPRRPSGASGAATAISTKSIRGSRSTAPRRSNIARYANHSCNPNAETYTYGGQVFIRAMRKIKPDEEITYDYGNDYLKYVIGRSHCKCSRCRRRRARKQREARALKKRRMARRRGRARNTR